ncbi:MAG: BCCT family transporter, partial [Myxococcota bacterium]|nr:BCCT family transporter [Myxococcota bacterium]
WGWFLGYAPIMSAFVARISRGRSVRELIVAVIVVAPLLTHMWFAILGGTGLGLEVSEPGVITTVLAEQGMASTLIAIVGALPLAPLWIGIALLLVFCFLATTADSMAYAISVVITEKDTPPISHRLSWAFGMGLLTALLLLAGNGSINALQQFIVVTAVPVTLILLPTAITAPLALRAATKNTTLQTD